MGHSCAVGSYVCSEFCSSLDSIYVLFGEQWPSYKVSSFDCFDPCGFDWVAAHGMHPLDRLLDRWEIIDTVGLPKCLSCSLIGRFMVCAVATGLIVA